MFSTNQSLNQIQAGLHQAAETTNAVNSELYQRWQRVFPGSNMPLPYSPGAQVSAQNLGINLNQAPPGAPAQGVQQGPTQPARAAQQAAPQQLTSKSGRPIKPDGKGGFVYAD